MTVGINLLDAEAHRKNGRQLVYLFDDTDQRARVESAAIAENRLLPIGTFLENLRKCRELLSLFRISQTGSEQR